MLSPFQVPLPQSQPASLALSTTPIFISSTDTTPISQVVCNALNLHAALLLTNDAYIKALPTTIKNTIDQLAKTTTENTFRSAFLNLVRQYPDLEEQYATGQLDQDIAIPLIAQLAHITRLIAALEQYTGEPFLESPSTTLAQCNNFLANYLSRGLPQVPHSREAQLLAEINRLMTEAQALDTRGLTIEATAVATLAEWRARALLKRAEIQQAN